MYYAGACMKLKVILWISISGIHSSPRHFEYLKTHLLQPYDQFSILAYFIHLEDSMQHQVLLEAVHHSMLLDLFDSYSIRHYSKYVGVDFNVELNCKQTER